MIRERALQVVLVLVGLLFAAAIYPVAMALLPVGLYGRHHDDVEPVFSRWAFSCWWPRKPSEHRSLMAFAAWSSFADAVVRSILGFYIPSEKVGFLIGSAVLVLIGVALLALAPAPANAYTIVPR